MEKEEKKKKVKILLLTEKKAKGLLQEYMVPGTTILVAGKKRTGSIDTLAWLTWDAVKNEGAEVLTNMVYKQKQADGTFKMAYPAGVTFVNSFLDIMIHTARILKEGTKKIVVVLQGIHNFAGAYDWNSPMVKDFVMFLNSSTELRQIWIMESPDVKMFPRAIRDPDGGIGAMLLYHDVVHTYDFNFEFKKKFKTPELCFMERPGMPKQVWVSDVCPWARPQDNLEPGDIVVDHMVPGSTVYLGRMGSYEFTFRDPLDKLDHCIAEDIPARLIDWIKEIEGYKRYLEFLARKKEEEAKAKAAAKEKKLAARKALKKK